MPPPSKLSVQRAEEVMERATPLLVAALSVAMIVLFPLCISNFHNLHTKGWFRDAVNSSKSDTFAEMLVTAICIDIL